MQSIGDMPYLELEFDADGKLKSPAQRAAVIAAIEASGASQIVVISHGWRSSADAARKLYEELLSNVGHRLASLAPERAKATVVGILWPSLAFPESKDLPEPPKPKSGGAASTAKRSMDLSLLEKRLDQLSAVADPALVREAKAQLELLDTDAQARKKFVVALRKMMPPSTQDPSDLADGLFASVDPEVLFQRLEAPALPPRKKGAGGGAGLGSAKRNSGGPLERLDGLVNGFTGSAWRMLNYLTYYQMKERAGIVGATLGEILDLIREKKPQIKLHLVGHSFGARLIASAVKRSPSIAPASMCLLQAAFSHNGFAAHYDGKHDGFFRDVVGKGLVQGGILITHTENDEAVGTAYAIASRIALDDAKAIGDASDKFGGLGRNGALHLAAKEFEGIAMQAEGTSYAFKSGLVTNLAAGDLIKSHGDVRNAAVANVVAHAISTF